MLKLKPSEPLFKKILVANRGEIANRVIRTCRRLHIKTVAVYSEADTSALHVKQADEAILIGPPPATDSYLNLDAVIRAAVKTGADALHPGYGFLSESTELVHACEQAGVQFIGPQGDVMERMKDKAHARQLAQQAGLPLLPGTDAKLSDEDTRKIAKQIGYPLMVKAAYGGGGIGIRIVESPNQLQENVTRARSLAQSSFGNNQIYLEKFLESPSHVEVQVLADHHGNAVHLFERDCSIQRRNQKVVEETPCLKLDDIQREAIYQAALDLVHHVGYTNAGTIEFLLDQYGKFYFIEMNTRLQVEHPVTEMVTGLDMVEHQIRIAAGEPLPFSQSEITSHGHAIEARIYPEDPITLLPTTGTVGKINEPKENNLRIDTSLYQGYEVLPYYDSLMAKVISWGATREDAISLLDKAVTSYHIPGITSNIPTVRRVLGHPDFIHGEYSTKLLSQLAAQCPENQEETSDSEKVAAIVTALGSLFGGKHQQHSSAWKTSGRAAQMSPQLTRGGRW